MQIKLTDNTELTALNASAGRENLEGAYRDVMSLEFDPETYSFDQLNAVGHNEENLQTLTVAGDDGTEYPYEGYVLFGGLSLLTSGRFRLKLGQLVSARESELTARLHQAQQAAEILANGEV